MMPLHAPYKGPPPSFEEARNLRQQARAAGLDPNYWYPAEWSGKLKRGQVCEVVFWGEPIALYRTQAGEVHALANRCAHRQFKLSVGVVSKDCLICPYHGWTYNGSGQVVEILHDLCGKRMPKYRIRSYPVRERYGLIWIFPGDAALAVERAMPEIPEHEGSDPWPHIHLDFTWKAHHSIVTEQSNDLNHAFLHRKHKPFWNPELADLRRESDAVSATWTTKVAGGRLLSPFVDHVRINTNEIVMDFEYPFVTSNVGGELKHWMFCRPIDGRTTRAFFLLCFKRVKLPLLPGSMRGFLLQRFLPIARHHIIRPVMVEDGEAAEIEQEGYEAHWDAPPAEINPVVHDLQRLTVRKWREHLSPPASQALQQPTAVHA